MKKRFPHLKITILLLAVLLLFGHAAHAEELQAKVDAIIAECIRPDMSTYEKASALHNWVINNVVYDDVDGPGGEGHTAYDAIVLGRGVCQAYAAGYAALLDAAGINNAYEYGYEHVWNLVEMDGQWYHVDCTWDDSTSNSFTYFFLPNDALEGVGNHECYNQVFTGHDYTYSYLYRNGLLDEKLNSITSYIQKQFDRGIFDFLFIPSVSLYSANGSGLGDSRVEFNLIKMILPEYSYTANGLPVEADISLDWDTEIVTVHATAPEGWIPEEETPDPESAFVFEASEDNPRYRLIGYTGSASKVEIPDGVVEIYEGVFEDCATMHSLVIPDSVTSIRGSAFRRCINLKTVRMSQCLTNMGSYVFANCVSLQEISLPDCLQELSYSVFQECLSLKKVKLPAKLQSMGSHAFLDCASLEAIEIPGTVPLIPYSAFNGCKSLKRVTLNEGTQRIDEHVFRDCSSLESIHFPESLTAIGEWSFMDCSSLQEVVWPDRIDILPPGIFCGCSSLRSITLPDNISIISVNALAECSKLEFIRLPSALQELQTYAFRDCTALQKIIIPASVSLIDDRAFKDTSCTWLVYQNSYALSRAQELGREYKIIDQDLVRLVLPGKLVNVEAEAFMAAPVQQIVLPDGLAKIGEHAFAFCTDLLRINMPDSITFIADNAFEGSPCVEFICESNNAAARYAREKGIPCTIE